MSESELPFPQSIYWKDGEVWYIDQRKLPGEYVVQKTNDWREIAEAIRTLAVRGAPLTGIAAAYGVALAALHPVEDDHLRNSTYRAISALAKTRPTAVNLFWALQRMKYCLETRSEWELAESLVVEALKIHEDDRSRCKMIGRHGVVIVPKGANILTVCNTGFLATGGIGTALGIVYTAHQEGLRPLVYACETRPLLQGSRLTAWELKKAGIPVTLIIDSVAAGLVRNHQVDVCIIGADRIAANGDTANKIGSYQLALACREHKVPFHVAGPTSTIDSTCGGANSIDIEQRDAQELLNMGGVNIAPDGVAVYNPAFDIVPAELIDSIITEEGISKPPYRF